VIAASLAGELALITGGARGIGFATALCLGENGARILINDVDGDAAHSAALALQDQGIWASAVPADIADERQIVEAYTSAEAEFGTPAILVNNAGVSPKRAAERIQYEDITLREWDDVLSVNVTGAFLCSRLVLPGMRRRGWGRIVNIASVMGKLGSSGPPGASYGPHSPSGAHYCVSKAALICLTKCIAREVAPEGITCNAVAPGAIEGGMASQINGAATSKQIPIGRLGRQVEVAAAVLFLVSHAAAYITGETRDVNGGWVMD
jgi:3-oxoacyl-[acyl-carrier protein] reductase